MRLNIDALLLRCTTLYRVNDTPDATFRQVLATLKKVEETNRLAAVRTGRKEIKQLKRDLKKVGKKKRQKPTFMTQVAETLSKIRLVGLSISGISNNLLETEMLAKLKIEERKDGSILYSGTDLCIEIDNKNRLVTIDHLAVKIVLNQETSELISCTLTRTPSGDEKFSNLAVPLEFLGEPEIWEQLIEKAEFEAAQWIFQSLIEKYLPTSVERENTDFSTLKRGLETLPADPKAIEKVNKFAKLLCILHEKHKKTAA
jgi:hypothetical protein